MSPTRNRCQGGDCRVSLCNQVIKIGYSHHGTAEEVRDRIGRNTQGRPNARATDKRTPEEAQRLKKARSENGRSLTT